MDARQIAEKSREARTPVISLLVNGVPEPTGPGFIKSRMSPW